MVFDTLTWLRSVVVSYKQGAPHLLQYSLKDDELINLGQLIDALTAARVEEALQIEKDKRENGDY